MSEQRLEERRGQAAAATCLRKEAEHHIREGTEPGRETREAQDSQGSSQEVKMPNPAQSPGDGEGGDSWTIWQEKTSTLNV